MGVSNTYGNDKEAVTYSLRKKLNGNYAFLTNCGPDDQGAMRYVRSKDGKHHKAGDEYFMHGGDRMTGTLIGTWIQNGYSPDGSKSVAKDLSLGFKSQDADGEPVVEFIKLPLVSDKGRIDGAVVRLLQVLKEAELGEEVELRVRTETHKAGDPMNSTKEDGPKWEKDGVSISFPVVQSHLKDADGKGGYVKTEAAFYQQPRFYLDGSELIPLAKGQKAPEGVQIQYNTKAAIEYVDGIRDAIKARIGNGHQAPPPENPEGDGWSDEDTTFGNDPAPARPRP